MKFEIELTEEEAKQFIECQHLGPITPHRVAEQIKAQLPKEKKYKFLVGYIKSDGSRAKSGMLESNILPEGGYYDQKIYGFTEEQLVDFVGWYWSAAIRNPKNYPSVVQEYLKTQEAE